MSGTLTRTDTTRSPSPVDICPTRNGDLLAINVTIRQDPLSVTLDGPAIFFIAILLILSTQLLQPSTVAFLISVFTLVVFVHNDYQNYLKLGPGGTPATFAGYIRINWFKLWACRDPFTPLPADPDVQPAAGILREKPLPYRCGLRPKVVGIAPQRQVDQFGSRDCYLTLRRILESHSRNNPEELGIGTSCFEKHGLALFSRYPFNKTCQGEICHVHNSDYSMHLNLHPDDVKEVIEKGWGQRHPLTSQCFLKMPVPKQFTMVYAPRSMDELKVVCQIIEAAGWWVSAKEMKLNVMGEK
ncbi:hypothetical protein F4815DRAFT_135426 [Daldinia loculata]|uniref:uncharacterized protein n=1 Tax=Daldinia loculata TaxID=103429 RepID=UPI0020C2378D|nr:uncharacterized protein F4817DRAFT_330161 [Daldinia loculata]KAI1649791.1 hypothetical protein F4817DRAFT_330161 [Daldinia loculata]KAI2784765.1 hypothetical protein F4815DRAFT_135426 [Daldinia loculata]